MSSPEDTPDRHPPNGDFHRGAMVLLEQSRVTLENANNTLDEIAEAKQVIDTLTVKQLRTNPKLCQHVLELLTKLANAAETAVIFQRDTTEDIIARTNQLIGRN